MTQKRSQWDAGRFLKTLTYFEVLPFVGWLQKLLTGTTNKNISKRKDMGVILVAGATGGVGKRVVRRLVERNYPVRALVRDAERARELLGDIDIFEADITVPETLTPQIAEQVTAVICCTGVRVQPVEGDTPSREKYYQGIKFYLPEVVDSPEAVDYQGIKNLLQAMAKMPSNEQKPLFDFTHPSTDVKDIWGAVDDVVMGGVSESGIRLGENRAIFAGVVSTENNGGFASVRTRNFNPAWDLSGYEGIELRVKGDGKRYKFIIRCEEKWDGIGYSYSFDTISGDWTTVQIPFAELIPVFRAKIKPDAGAIAANQVCSMQLMLSKFEYDGELKVQPEKAPAAALSKLNPQFEPGEFRLEVQSINAYGGHKMPQFVMISSAGVTRPGRPGLDLENEPPAVRMNDQLGGILTWKLRGEEAVRDSGLTYTIVRPCALTEAPERSLKFDQGDTLKGQVSREAIAELCIQALHHPQASLKTFEVCEDGMEEADWGSLFAQMQPDC